MNWFKNYRNAVIKHFSNKDKETEKHEPLDEWVWVEGYKGTNKDMKCNDLQYELGKTYSMPRDKVIMCVTGYHLCKNLSDVHHYYEIGHGNRFFKVRALVRQSDLDKYGTREKTNGYLTFGSSYYSKLVAAEIEFLEELSIDEILANTSACDWSDKYKKLAIEISLGTAKNHMLADILTDLGYSDKLALHIVRKNLFSIAEAVGSQPNLSMDMKVWAIFNGR